MESFAFFAVKVRVARIGEDVSSPMAPLLEALERPSVWDRCVRNSAVGDNSLLNERRQFRHDFWRYYVERRPDDIQLRPNPHAYPVWQCWTVKSGSGVAR